MQPPKHPAKPKKVIVFGTFDLLHKGHEHLIRQALRHGKVTIVVARDENVLRIKSHLPTQKEDERARAIENRFPETKVVLGGRKSYLDIVHDENPDLILLGYDQRLPPGITADRFQCPILRAKAFNPRKYKSSLIAKKKPMNRTE